MIENNENHESGVAGDKRFIGGNETDTTKNLKSLIGGRLMLGGLAGSYEMIYRDSKGNIGNRDIILYALVEREGELELDTYSRNNRFASCRTYKVENIEKIRNLRTGEVVDQDVEGYLLGLAEVA